MSQKICLAESGTGSKLPAATGYHGLTCFLEAGKDKVVATEGLQDDNKHRQNCSGLICSKPNHKLAFG